MQWLMERVEYRSERAVRERISRRTSRRIEKIFDDTEQMRPDDETYAEVNRMALSGATQFLSVLAREKISDDARRDKEAMRAAIERGRAAHQEQARLPSPEEAEQFLHMLRDAMGPTEFDSIVEKVKPKELPG